MGQIGVYMCTIECWWCGSKRVMQRLNEYAGWNNQHTNVSHFKKQMMTIISFSGSDFNDIRILLECTCSNDHKNKNPAQRNEEVADRGDRHIHGKELKCFNYDESNHPEGRRLWHHDKRFRALHRGCEIGFWTAVQRRKRRSRRPAYPWTGTSATSIFLGSPSIKDKKRSDVAHVFANPTPLSKSDLSNFRRALSYAMKSLWTRPGHSLSHGSHYFACLASFQRWMVLSTLSTMILHKKMRKPVRSQKDYKSYTKFRTGEGMMMAQTVAELGARFTA